MTDQQHPITPPQELVREWARPGSLNGRDLYIADQAARWGADQELSECCKWLPKLPPWSADDLRKHRRPKPPSLKELALATLDDAILRGDCITISDALPILRRALEQLDD